MHLLRSKSAFDGQVLKDQREILLATASDSKVKFPSRFHGGVTKVGVLCCEGNALFLPALKDAVNQKRFCHQRSAITAVIADFGGVSECTTRVFVGVSESLNVKRKIADKRRMFGGRLRRPRGCFQ